MSSAARGGRPGAGSPAGRGTFVPWPVAPAIGAVAGAACGVRVGPGTAVAVAALFALGGLLLWRKQGWGWPHALSGLGVAALIPFAPLLLVGAALGAGRAGTWQLGPSERARAELAREWSGVEAEWRGRSDGELLHATHPMQARLALVLPGGAPAPVGRLSVRGAAEPAPGARNPGGFDYAAHLARRGVAGQLFVREVVALVPGKRPSDRLARGVTAGLPVEAGALMLAMTLGRREGLGSLRDAFGAAGMAHLLALSGLHVGVLALALSRLLAGLPRLRAPLVALATLTFVWLVGPSPSVVRAATMGLAALLVGSLGLGRAPAWATLGLAALAGTLTAPQMVLDLGFQLSYLAVVGMLVFLPPWTARLGPARPGARGLRRVRATLVRGAALGALTSLSAQLPTLSLVAGTFHAVPLASPLLNVLAVPLAGLAVPLGLLAGLLGAVAEPLAWPVNLLVRPLAGGLLSLAELGARLPSLPWADVTPAGHAAWAAFTALLAAWSWGRARLTRVLGVTLLLGGSTYALPPPHRPPDAWFLDVGQGDAVLLRPARGLAVLVDGGGTPFSDYDVGARVVVPALRALGVTALNAVIATHPDADHVEGLLSVLDLLPVALLVTGPPRPGNPLDEALRAAAARRGVPVHEARRGEALQLGPALLELLNPPADVGGLSDNDASVAFALRLDGEPRALFLGDLGSRVEPELAVPPVDVLMVGHHGSRGSTGEPLVRAAGPVLAVVSVGRNAYGHPTAEVIERLEAHGATVVTTRAEGAVRVGLRGPLHWAGTAGGGPGAGGAR